MHFHAFSPLFLVNYIVIQLLAFNLCQWQRLRQLRFSAFLCFLVMSRTTDRRMNRRTDRQKDGQDA